MASKIMNLYNHKPICHKCSTVGDLNEQYDAYYCSNCNTWLEEQCGDPNCRFCVNRPNKPLGEIENGN